MARKPRAVVKTTPATYEVPKLTLSLAVAEATDYVTATAGNASGIASFEFKYGESTGVYGDPVSCPRNFMDIYAETEDLYVICRGIAFDGSIGEWSDEATISIAKNDFVTFEFPESEGSAVIDTVAHTVALNVVDDTNPAALVATFTLTSGASATVAAAPQESGVTANDFTNPVTYVVTGADSAAQNWTITVTVLKDAGKAITAFDVPGQVGDESIDAEAHTVSVHVPHDTDVSALVATFAISAEASAAVGATPQESGVTANNFASPVVYRVTAEDLTYQDWTVTVVVNAATNNFTAFSVPTGGSATIDASAHTVAVTVPHGTDETALIATFTLTAGASAKVGNTVQVSGDTQNDFTAPVVYAVMGADEVVQNWTVTVTVAA